MPSLLPVRRRALIYILGSAATAAVPQTAAAQQASGNNTDETPPGNGTVDDRADPEASDEDPSTEMDGEADNTEQDTEPFEPTLALDCYLLSVDGESYDGVELRFADSTTVTYDDRYSGTTRFGYSGDGRLDSDAQTAVTEFHGPIAWATVISGGAFETVTNSGRCPFSDLFFECDAAEFSRGNDVRMRFVDGSVKRWDPPADSGQTRFGSPGRVVESVSEESADIEVPNPNLDCEPGDYATVFDCTEVTVGPGEFAAEPTFDRVILTFVDGSTQSFGRQGESGFTAPETFAGTEANAGKLIESIGIDKRDGDISFRLVNSTVDDCEPLAADDSEAASADDDGGAATETPAGGAGGGAGSDPSGSQPGSSGGGSGSTDSSTSIGSESVVDEVVGGQLPWWGWTAAAGGAAGTLSYLVSRTLGEGSEMVDSTAQGGDGSESVDEPLNRWEHFGNK